MPTLSQLKYIVAVDHFRHFAKASKHCHIAQPSLSIQIQKAEDELGIVIFDRNKKPVLPTPQGIVIIEQARKVLRQHEQLLATAKNRKNVLSGDLRVGIIPTILPYLVPLFIRHFVTKFKEINLVIEEMKTDEIVEALKSDYIDAGILATPLEEAGIREKVLYHEDFVVYLNSNNPLSKKKTINLDNVSHKKDIWLLKDGNCLKNQVMRLCAGIVHGGPYSNFKFQGGNLETLRKLIQETEGYTLVPWSFARMLPASEQKKCVREFSEPKPVREVSIVYTRDQWKKELIGALHKVIVDSLPKGFASSSEKKTEVIGIT